MSKSNRQALGEEKFLSVSSDLYYGTKQYRDLRPGDEFDTYCGIKMMRVKTISVRTEGDRVIAKIKPVNRPRDEVVQRYFVASGEVRVFHQEIDSSNGVRQSKVNPAIVEQVKLVLTYRMGAKTVREVGELIGDRTGARPSDPALKLACDQLVKEGTLVRHQSGALTGRYRRLLEPDEALIGLPVIEAIGTPSQREGWILRFEILRTTGMVHPICQWLDGTTSFSSDDLMEPATQPSSLRRVAVAKALLAGERPEGFISVPGWLLERCMKIAQDTPKGVRYKPHTFYRVAQSIGQLEEGQQGNWSHYGMAIDHLDLYYPGWRRGRLIFPPIFCATSGFPETSKP